MSREPLAGLHMPAESQAVLVATGEELVLAPRSRLTRLRQNALVRNLLFNPVNLLGVIIVLVVVFLAFFGETLAPYSPIQPDYNAMLVGPSPSHPFGTDTIGYDIYSRV